MHSSTFFNLLLFCLALATLACNNERTEERAGEVGEEVAEGVDKLSPAGEGRGEVAAKTVNSSAAGTIAAAQNAGGLLKLPVGAATANIDGWIEDLRANPAVDDSDDLVDNLMNLRGLLAASPINGEAVSEVLENLATETRQAAKDADDSAVATLADALDAAADALD